MTSTKILLITAASLLLPLGAFAGFIGKTQMSPSSQSTTKSATKAHYTCAQLNKMNKEIPPGQNFAIDLPARCYKKS